MENKDFVTEQILSIEDFENVDEKLMCVISDNDEYRRIFEEYREISALCRESVPKPVKNGRTLRKAVMDRVKKGDVSPRYINSSKFKFPIATVASLAVVVAVTIILNKGGFLKKASDASVNNMSNIELSDTVKDEEAKEKYKYTSFGTKKTARKESVEDESVIVDDAKYADYSSSVNGIADTELPESKNGIVTHTLSDDITDGMASYDSTEPVKSGGGVMSAPKAANGAALKSGDETDDAARVEEDTAEKSVGGETESCKFFKAAEAGTAQSEECAVEAETVMPSENPEIIKRIRYAEEKGVAKEKMITAKQIMQLGEDNFIRWFDSIKDSEDFAVSYRYEAFEAYCNAAE